MIDVESEVFTVISTALRAEFNGIYVTGEYIAAPPEFPAVSIVEMDNNLYTKTMDLAGTENHISVMYEINIYSNLSSGKKSQCKSIMAFIDKEMQKFSFVRTGSGPIELPNSDATKYRMNARYRAVISKNKAIHRIS